jgi:hypothetical protein
MSWWLIPLLALGVVVVTVLATLIGSWLGGGL